MNFTLSLEDTSAQQWNNKYFRNFGGRGHNNSEKFYHNQVSNNGIQKDKHTCIWICIDRIEKLKKHFSHYDRHGRL